MAGFMRSPDAVFEVNAYQEAVPQPEAAKAGAEADKATIKAAENIRDFIMSG